MSFSETELAFAENLILIAKVPGTHVIYLLRSKELVGDTRMLWELAAEMGFAAKSALNDCYRAAKDAVEEAGSQDFSFSDGAMIGPWELVHRVAGWIGGEVWRGERPGAQALVRLVPPGTGSDEERMARFVERSNPGLEPPHPSIIKIDEAAEDFGWLYTASIGVEGEPLAALLERGPLAERSALSCAHGIATALKVIHGLGVVHGGLNPLGVVVRDSRPHLFDFGTCSAMLDGPCQGNRPGGRLGQLLFSAPALIHGDATRGLDARDDLHALGAIIYLLVCDPQPHDQPGDADSPWFAEPRLAAPTRELLTRLLSGETSAYPSADSLLGDLGAVAQGGALSPLPTEPSARGRRDPQAKPQRPLGYDAPAKYEPDEDEAPAPAKASDRLKKGKSSRLGKTSDRLKKGKSSRLGKTSGIGKSSRSGRQLAKPKGSGWGILLGTLTLLGGAVGGLVMVAQPKGKEKARDTLVSAFQVSRVAPVEYDVVLDLVERALGEAAGDPEVARDAFLLRRATLAAALRERAALLGATNAESSDEPGAAEGGDVVAKLRELRQRITNSSLEPLIDYDLTTRKQGENTVALVWADLGRRLLQAGHPIEAADALERGSAPERRRAELASAMAFVPGGQYLVPAEEADGLVLKWRGALYLGKTEVSRGEYRRFLAAIGKQESAHEHCDQTEPKDKEHAPEGWPVRPGTDDALPATGVDYYDASAYASWLGGSLADLATLQAASQGPMSQPYPWGQASPSLTYANCAELLGGDPTPCGSFPGGAGVGGALDLLGNVAEWIRTEDMKPTKAGVWGGDCKTAADALTAGVSEELDLTARSERVGFRIVLGVKAEE